MQTLEAKDHVFFCNLLQQRQTLVTRLIFGGNFTTDGCVRFPAENTRLRPRRQSGRIGIEIFDPVKNGGFLWFGIPVVR